MKDKTTSDGQKIEKYSHVAHPKTGVLINSDAYEIAIIEKMEREAKALAEAEARAEDKVRSKPKPEKQDLDFSMGAVTKLSSKETEIDFTFEGVTIEEPEPEPEPELKNDFYEEMKKFFPESSTIVPINDRVHALLPEGVPTVSIDPVAHSKEWHEIRRAGIGSSDVGAILGVSPFSTAVEIFNSKIGVEQEEKFYLKPYADFGTWFEPVLRQIVEDECGISITPGEDLGSISWSGWPVLRVNIDGICEDDGIISEIKTSNEVWETIPENYFAQVQYQMLCTGADQARIHQLRIPESRKFIISLKNKYEELGVWNTPGVEQGLIDTIFKTSEIKNWIVERDQEYIDQMLEVLRSFWEHVQQRIEPEPLDLEMTTDLTSNFNAVATMLEYVQAHDEFKEMKPIQKRLDDAKKVVRLAIERAVALSGTNPKRVTVAGHGATKMKKGKTTYWQVYTKKTGQRIKGTF